MARVVYSGLVTDIRGKIGDLIFTQWKGIPTVKKRPTHQRYPWESTLNAVHRNEVIKLCKAWRDDLTQNQRDGWQDFADYLATLSTNYTKLLGWKNYGGTMSSFDAFVLANCLRWSIGYTDLLEDDPTGEDSPIEPEILSATYSNVPPKTITVSSIYEEFPDPTTIVRLWLRGKRYAHLILAAYEDIQTGAPGSFDVLYEADEEPPAATPPWTLVGTDYASVSGGILTIGTGGNPNVNTLFKRTAAETYDKLSFECKMKVEDSTGYADIYLLLGTGGNEIWVLDLNIYRDILKTYYHPAGRIDYNHDFKTDYSVIRAEIVAGHGKVWVDGTIAFDEDLNAQAGDYYLIQFGRIAFVDIDSYWDYVGYSFGDFPYNLNADIEITEARFAQGNTLSLPPDIYQVQMDAVNEFGRFSPPSNIVNVTVT